MDWNFWCQSLSFELHSSLFLLALDLGVILALCCLVNYYLCRSPLCVPRHFRRNAKINVFIVGLSPKTVLLRLPGHATTDTVVQELLRRRLLPHMSYSARLSFNFQVNPGGGALARILSPFQILATAGVWDMSTIHVRYCLPGGAESSAGPSNACNDDMLYCRGCGTGFGTENGLEQHQTRGKPRKACKQARLDYEKDFLQSLPRRLPISDSGQEETDAFSPGGHNVAASTHNPDPQPDAASPPPDNSNADPDAMEVDSPPGLRPPDPRHPHASPKETLGSDSHRHERQATEDQPDARRAPSVFNAAGLDEEEDEDADLDHIEHLRGEYKAVDDTGPARHDVGPKNANDVPPGEPDMDDAVDGDTPAPEPVPLPPTQDREVKHFGLRAGECVDGPGVPQNQYRFYQGKLKGINNPDNPYHPFETKRDWEVADWAKTHSIGSNALTALLKIPGVVAELNLGFHTTQKLNEIIDNQLPERPQFEKRLYELGGEIHELFLRDTLKVVADLFGRADFAKHLKFAPEKQYTFEIVDGERKKGRVISDMHTAKWWWKMQEQLEDRTPGATIIPLIISTDKTQLTMFRNKSAYPIYLTIGNLPKELRRKGSLQAQVLVGYLPVSNLKGIPNADIRRRGLANLYHMCMADVLEPLKKVAEHGIVMTAGDGLRRRCHPLIAAFVADYPEQILAAGVKYGQCPKGNLSPELFGTQDLCNLRGHVEILAAHQYRGNRPTDTAAFLLECEEYGIKPITPFWHDYPYADIYQSITPDILHQLYQGVVKHLVLWLKKVYGADAIDAKFKTFPHMQQLRIFNKGISVLSQVSGAEHQDICRCILGAILDLPLRGKGNPKRVVLATRALLDFVYLAQYAEASESTLAAMRAALRCFHENKEVFIQLGARKHMNFPKMHALAHYVECIQLFGTPDNFNTAHSERAHIDFIKWAYEASNKKDELPQMTLWVQRAEKMRAHRMFVLWRLAGSPPAELAPPAPLPGALKLKKNIASTPHDDHLSWADAERLYCADDIQRLFTEHVIKMRNLGGHDNDNAAIARVARHFKLPITSVQAFNRIKFWHTDTYERDCDMVQEIPDSVVARPAYSDKQGRQMPGRFHTALIDDEGLGAKRGIEGNRVGRVRLIFNVADRHKEAVFGDDPTIEIPSHFVYVEWFTKFKKRDPLHGLYRIQRDLENNVPLVSIESIDAIRRSVSLIPRYGPKETNTASWTSANVMDKCVEFYVNSFSDKHAYATGL